MKATIFLDRDGVINELVGPSMNRGPRNPSELKIRPDFRNFIAQVSHLPANFVVVTNQPDISRGKLFLQDNEVIKAAVLNELPPGTLYLECPHDNADGCICRKPQNGMIEAGLQQLKADRSQSLLIGDSWTDILAGQSSNLFTILLARSGSYSQTSQGSAPELLKPDEIVESLVDLLFSPTFIKFLSK